LFELVGPADIDGTAKQSFRLQTEAILEATPLKGKMPF